MKPLTHIEFCDALRKGMGKAAIHLHDHGSRGVEADILNACVNSLGYDPQCEGTRGEWLWRMLDFAGMKEVARPRILLALREAPTGWQDTWTAAQLFVLALLYAKEGDQESRQAIYDKFDLQQYNESWLGGLQIISLDGMAGMLHVAQVIGGRLLRESGYCEDGYLLSVAREEFGEEAMLAYLSEHGRTDERVRAFLNEMDRQKQKDGQTPQAPLESLQHVLAAIEQAKDRCLWLRRWGRRAGSDEIDAVFKAMLEEDRPAQLTRYLMIFGTRQLPSLPERVLQLAESTDEDVRNAAITAFTGMRDTVVRELAIKLLNQTPPRLKAVRLLARNYTTGDHSLVESVLPAHGDTETVHDLGLGILKVLSETKDPLLSTCIEWLYENGPCSECRHSVVDDLIEFDAAKTDVLHECLMDCSEDTRKAARKALGFPADQDWITSL